MADPIDVPIPFPTGSYPGKNRAETGGRIINGVVEPLAENAEAQFVVRRAPGLVVFGDSGKVGYRGAMMAGSAMYAAFEDEIVKFDDTGAATSLSGLDGDQPVTFARNNKMPVFDTVVVTEQGAFTVDATTGASSFPDPDLPQPTDVCHIDGYFIFGLADSRIFASGTKATTVSALDFTTFDYAPGVLYRVLPHAGRLIVMKSTCIGVYQNTANPTGFPFTREAVITGPGLGGKWAVAGYETGWDKGLFWLGSDNGFHTRNGYSAVRISTPDQDRDVERVPPEERNSIRARCYIEAGHAYVEWSCDYWCWTFDVTTQKWHEGRSYNEPTRRAVGPSVYAFGKWLSGDRLSGQMLENSDQAYREVDQPMPVEIWSGKCKTFPYGARVVRADFTFVKGVGNIAGDDPVERDPQVEISWSDDGGNEWSNPVHRDLGRVGRRTTKVTLSGAVCGVCGQEGRIWRIRMSDPRDFALLDGNMQVLRAAR